MAREEMKRNLKRQANCLFVFKFFEFALEKSLQENWLLIVLFLWKLIDILPHALSREKGESSLDELDLSLGDTAKNTWCKTKVPAWIKFQKWTEIFPHTSPMPTVECHSCAMANVGVSSSNKDWVLAGSFKLGRQKTIAYLTHTI